MPAVLQRDLATVWEGFACQFYGQVKGWDGKSDLEPGYI